MLSTEATPAVPCYQNLAMDVPYMGVTAHLCAKVVTGLCLGHGVGTGHGRVVSQVQRSGKPEQSRSVSREELGKGEQKPL